jgi:hypothetical protein
LPNGVQEIRQNCSSEIFIAKEEPAITQPRTLNQNKHDVAFFYQNREIMVEEKNKNSPEIRIKGRLRNSYFQKNISFIGVKCSIVKLLDRFFAQKK